MFRKITRQGSLLNPFIQALLFAVLVIFFLPSLFSKYKFEIVQSNNSPDKFIQKYIEIDGDGYNEKIVLHYGTNFIPPKPQVSVFGINDSPLFNFTLEHSWIDKNNLFYADLNKNTKNELFIFTQSQDTIYLNLFEHFSSDSISSKTIMAETVKSTDGNYDLWINHIGNSDVNGDGSEEFVFIIMTSFDKELRGVFAWDLVNNSIIRSPKLAVSADIEQFYLCDIDRDGHQEILLSTYVNSFWDDQKNINSKLSFSDTASYVVALDHDLSLLFDPIPLACRFAYSLPLQTEAGIKIAVLISNEEKGIVKQEINLYNPNGTLYKSKLINTDMGFCADWIFTKNNSIDDEFFMVQTKGQVICFDADLEIIDSWNIQPIEAYPIKPIDLDNDGKNEFIFKKVANSIYTNDFIITQNNLSYPINIKFEGRLYGASITHKDQFNNKGSFLLQLSNEDSYLCKYYENKNYKFKYLAWVLIYVIFFAFIALIQWAQRIKTRNKINKEKELAKFQIMAIKNQVDPHFTLNTLNTISSLYGKGENQEAYKYMTKLSRLMLLVLNESDQISSTLKAEIEMIKSYIELQLIRFRDVFTYSIDWDEDRLGEREVPRMLIHTFTENAIKHGLRLRSKNGVLKINIRERNKYLIIIIEDNGVGRKAASLDKSLSSGKGVGISNSICQLYHQLRNVKVTYHIDDLLILDKETNLEVPAGTRVTITIHPKIFKI